jgi:ABC-type Zn uptake system ZnuABC Zn-binding protein ZnuA
MRKLLCALGICLVTGCSKQGAGPAAGSPAPEATPVPKLLVMATIAPMYCFTRNVAGDLADVEMIVPPGTDARGFEPSTEEVQRILEADVVVENGFGFEGWMDRLEARGLKPGAIRVIAARGTGPGIPGLPGDPNTPPGNAPLDLFQPPDPHVWLDPMMAIKEVQNIRDALMARDPAHADQYLANENRYEATLRDLDDEVGRMTVDIPKRRLFCVGSAFSYFLSESEFTVAHSAQEADAVLAPKESGAGILNGPGLRVVIADPMESGPASTDFYENGTRANAAALREGLLQ